METKVDVVPLAVFGKRKYADSLPTFGKGSMIVGPCAIGDWWCVPLSEWEKPIPAEAVRRVEKILKSENVIGFIIADDIRKVKKNEPTISAESSARIMEKVMMLAPMAAAIISIATAVIVVSVTVIASIIAYDPLLLAVLEDGRWVLLFEWDD